MTNNPDLYRALGVRHNASAATIERHYKAKARRVHPDAGGHVEQFKLVQLAYEVLIDTDRRAKYDATGATELPADQISPALAVIGALMDGLIRDMVKGGHRAAKHHLLNLVRDRLKADREKAASEIRNLQESAADLKTAADLWSARDGQENFMAAMTLAHVPRIEKASEQFAEQLAVFDQALEILSRFKYRIDLVRPAAARGEFIDAMRYASGFRWTGTSK